jgi:hypothetical protein
LDAYGICEELFPGVNFNLYPGGLGQFAIDLQGNYLTESPLELAKYIKVVGVISRSLEENPDLAEPYESFKDSVREEKRVAGGLLTPEVVIAAIVACTYIFGIPLRSWLDGLVDRHEIKRLKKENRFSGREAARYRALLKSASNDKDINEVLSSVGFDPEKWIKK